MNKILPLVQLLLCSFGLTAQIQIDRNDLNFSSEGFIEFRSLPDFQNLGTIARGPNQTWNFSGNYSSTALSYIFEPDSSPDFPTATLSSDISAAFGPFTSEGKAYFDQNDAGFFELGSVYEPVRVSLRSITFGPQDSLIVPPTVLTANAPLVRYPIVFGESYTTTYTYERNFVLTVALLGLSRANGLLKTSITETRTIDGWGDMILPNFDSGIGTVTYPALRMRYSYTGIDSAFINGQPAPPIVLSTFGVNQGEVTQRDEVNFYAPGFPFFAVTSFVDSLDRPADFFVSSESGFISTSVSPDLKAKEKFEPLSNPCIGNQLGFRVEKAGNEPWDFHLYDLAGQLISHERVDGTAREQWTSQAQVAGGAYFYTVQSPQQGFITMGKLIVTP